MKLFTEEEIQRLSANIDWAPIWEHWDRFVQIRSLTERSPLTLANVRDSIRVFALYGGFTTLESWIDKDAIFKAYDLKKAKRWSNVTFNTYRKNMSMYFNHLVEEGVLIANPMVKIKKAKEDQRNYDIPSDEDFTQIIEYLRSRKHTNLMEKKRNLLFFYLLAVTWARPSELLNLNLQSVANRKILEINGVKGGKPRTYPLMQVGEELLLDYIREASWQGRWNELDRYLFIWVKGKRRWSYSWVRKLLERINKESGVESNVTCYSFRRGVATHMHENGSTGERIMKYLWHVRLSTTMRYIQGKPEINQAGMDLMSGKFGQAFN